MRGGVGGMYFIIHRNFLLSGGSEGGIEGGGYPGGNIPPTKKGKEKESYFADLGEQGMSHFSSFFWYLRSY